MYAQAIIAGDVYLSLTINGVKMIKDICCIFNYPTHYRKNIYMRMEDELDCDFYFGDLYKDRLKMIDFSVFDKRLYLLDKKTRPF